MIDLKTAAVNHCESDFSVNVALRKPAKQIDVYRHVGHRNTANLAVDGNTDGNYNRKTMFHTNSHSTPWWYVDLQKQFTIKQIVVWHRTDCCKERATRFTTKIYLNGTPVFTKEWRTGISISSVIDVPSVLGDKVEISLQNKNNFLHLAEVEVYT